MNRRKRTRFNTRRLIPFVFWGLLAAWAGFPTAGHADERVSFHSDIAPLFTRACFRCHGPDESDRQADLRLDEREGAVRRLPSGAAAVVPGDVDNSELMRRIRSSDPEVRMPPVAAGEALSAHEIARIEQWIRSGADFEPHWSFTAVKPTSVPQPSDTLSWCVAPIDRFVLRSQLKHGLQHNPRADAEILIRRVTLDLTGLPPTPAEVAAFVHDRSPDAYHRLIDRLMASPAFGARWARPWLDVARYADSAGYAQDSQRTIWKYRDWVIQSINRGMPFDQFTLEQLAGDLLPHPSDEQLLATAFHRNTMTNSEGGTDDEEFRNAAVIDRVNTTLQVWMGLTMGCAQCHNHKYDPISQRDYYRFFAIFNNTQDADREDESPTLVTQTAEERKRKEQLTLQLAQVESALQKIESTTPPPIPASSGPPLTRFVRIQLTGEKTFLALSEVQVWVGQENVARYGTASQVSTKYNGHAHLALDGNTDGDFDQGKSTSHTEVDDQPWWEVDLGGEYAIDRVTVFNRVGKSSERLQKFRVIGLNTNRNSIWQQMVQDVPSPSVVVEVPQRSQDLTEEDRIELAKIDLLATPQRHAMRAQRIRIQGELATVNGSATPIFRELPVTERRLTHVHLRGNFRAPGELVTPGLPQSFVNESVEPNPSRLDVAKWLVDPDNPLTSRVMVNRTWETIFGIGIVETSEDFGLQGAPPSNPELLDYLAWDLQQNGWDVKRLIRTLVLSATYCQDSVETDQHRQVDPRNRWLARAPRVRLSAETLRDQALFVAGLLSQKQNGPSVRPYQPKLGLRAAFGGSTDWDTSPGEDRYRRGIYTQWRRTSPYPSMTTFDAPSREFCTVRRIPTNTPLQALVTLNDPVYIEAAQALARRIVREGGATNRDRLTFAWELCLARPAKETELAPLDQLVQHLLVQYAADQAAAEQMAKNPLGPIPPGMNSSELAAWTVVSNVLMNLDEFLACR